LEYHAVFKEMTRHMSALQAYVSLHYSDTYNWEALEKIAPGSVEKRDYFKGMGREEMQSLVAQLLTEGAKDEIAADNRPVYSATGRPVFYDGPLHRDMFKVKLPREAR
jgi:hypothetical protein